MKNNHAEIIFTETTGQQVLPEKYSSVFILADENTFKHCLTLLQSLNISREHIFIIPPGEENKNIDTCNLVWDFLLEKKADRKSLLINFGGGVITDLGGFAASTFKRGISFINIPTTLMAMADAAIGGKTGINFKNYKNQIGIFAFPEKVIINTNFLETLPENELKSGFAEVLKYGLIKDSELWQNVKDKMPSLKEWPVIIKRCTEIKTEITEKDPFEKGERKILNFGHTIGHSLESYSIEYDTPHLLHGEAVAAGMIMEAYLSSKKTGLHENELGEIAKTISSYFRKYQINQEQIPEIIGLMSADKKNENQLINFSLLKNIGECTIDVICNTNEIEEAILYYDDL